MTVKEEFEMRISLRLLGFAGLCLAAACNNAPAPSTLPPAMGTNPTSIAPTSGSPAASAGIGSSVAGSGAAGTTAAAGSSSTGPKAQEVPVAQCTAAHDQMLYQTQNDKIRNISSNCAAGKIRGPSGDNCAMYAGNPAEPKAVACFNDCVKPEMMTEFGDVLSDQCLVCPYAVVQCATKYCLAQCIANPMDPKCISCLCQTRADLPDPGVMGSCLYSVFQKCAGFMTTMDMVGCGAMAGAAGAAGGAAGTAAGAAGTAAGAAGAAGVSAGAAGTSAAAGASAGHAAGAGAAGHAGVGAAGSSAAAGRSGAAGR